MPAKRDIDFNNQYLYNLKNARLKDQDATPVGDLILINKDQTLLVRDPTDATYKTIHLNSVPDLSSLYSVIGHGHPQLHDRSHDVESSSDHPASSKKGLFLKTNASTGAIEIVAHGLSYGDVGAEASGAVSSHSGLTTGVHGVGAGTVAKVGDIATDTNLSTNAQDAVSKRHTRSHTLVSTSDHTSAVTVNKHFKADANGLPVEGSNTDAEIAAAVSATHAAVTLGTDADVLLGLSTQQLIFDTQVKNKILAGPTTGVDAKPTFRSLVSDDIPDISATYSVVGHTQAGDKQTYGSAANTACVGNDSRLSDTRTPVSHVHPTYGASAINRLAGVSPTISGWNTNPTNLANATDGDWSTPTGTGITNNLPGYAAGGYYQFDMGAIYNVVLRFKILVGLSVSGYSWVTVNPSDAGSDFSALATSSHFEFFAGKYVGAGGTGVVFSQTFLRGRYFRIACGNSNQGDTSLALYEVQTLDFGV